MGTNVVRGGGSYSYRAPLSTYAKAQVAQLRTNVPYVSAVLVLPDDWETRPILPLLIVCCSSGALAIPQVAGYTNPALAQGWAVLAADGPRLPPDRDSVMWNWGAVQSALDYLHRAIPRSRLWPVAVGGFSGGAKRAACVAAAAIEGRYDVWGVFMGGCNEDRASTGLLLYRSGAKYLKTRLFLSNGERDPIAGPVHGEAVKASMARSGFSQVTLKTYSGAHRLSQEHVREALQWFEKAGDAHAVR